VLILPAINGPTRITANDYLDFLLMHDAQFSARETDGVERECCGNP